MNIVCFRIQNDSRITSTVIVSTFPLSIHAATEALDEPRALVEETVNLSPVSTTRVDGPS